MIYLNFYERQLPLQCWGRFSAFSSNADNFVDGSYKTLGKQGGRWGYNL